MKMFLRLFAIFLVFAVVFSGCEFSFHDSNDDVSYEDCVASDEDAENCINPDGKGYLGLLEDSKKLGGVMMENEYLKSLNSKLFEMLSDDDWIEFKNDELGLSFMYPAAFGESDFRVDPGVTGSEVYIDFDDVKLTIGAHTKDFMSDGRGYSVFNYNGYELSMFGEDEFVEVFDVAGSEVVLFRGVTGFPDYFLYEGELGAFVRLRRNFPIVAFVVSDSNLVSLEVFKEILKTIEVY